MLEFVAIAVEAWGISALPSQRGRAKAKEQVQRRKGKAKAQTRKVTANCNFLGYAGIVGNLVIERASATR